MAADKEGKGQASEATADDQYWLNNYVKKKTASIIKLYGRPSSTPAPSQQKKASFDMKTYLTRLSETKNEQPPFQMCVLEPLVVTLFLLMETRYDFFFIFWAS